MINYQQLPKENFNANHATSEPDPEPLNLVIPKKKDQDDEQDKTSISSPGMYVQCS